MVLIEDNCSEDLDKLAMGHFQALIYPRNQDGKFHKTQSLIGRIEQQLLLDILIIERVAFWKFLLGNHYNNLERLITGRPDEIERIITEIEVNFGLNLFSRNISYNQASLTKFGVIVKDIFSYTNYRDNTSSRLNAEKLNIDYCPYCNLQKTQAVQITNGLTGNPKLIALYQLDHFYPQSRRPYLAISFFNLIPGCAPCNAVLKGEKDFNINTHFNPFNKRFNDYFNFRLTQVVYVKYEEVETKIYNTMHHDNNAIVDFGLEQRYNDVDCKRTAFYLITAYRNRSHAVKRSYISQIKGLFGTMDSTNQTLLQSQGVPLKANNINDFQMGKFKRDICKQLGLI